MYISYTGNIWWGKILAKKQKSVHMPYTFPCICEYWQGNFGGWLTIRQVFSLPKFSPVQYIVLYLLNVTIAPFFYFFIHLKLLFLSQFSWWLSLWWCYCCTTRCLMMTGHGYYSRCTGLLPFYHRFMITGYWKLLPPVRPQLIPQQLRQPVLFVNEHHVINQSPTHLPSAARLSLLNGAVQVNNKLIVKECKFIPSENKIC